MLTISSFFDIVIYSYFFDDERHGLPHIHAKYQGQEAVLSITDRVDHCRLDPESKGTSCSSVDRDSSR